MIYAIVALDFLSLAAMAGNAKSLASNVKEIPQFAMR